uniref:Cell envelope biogenesis protein TolA n=1 Tax=Rhodopseudomonas palustris (strain BisA53) TaxID=316055 RepID=Q07PJ3_RHOP5
MRVTLAETTDSALPQRIAAVASVAGHLAVVALALLAGVYPYESVNSGAIAVDIVRADEMPPPQETPSQQQPALDLPQLAPTEQQPASQPASPPESQQTAALDKPQPQQPQATPEKPQPPPQAAAAPTPQQPAAQAATSPAVTSWPPPMAPPQLPDITERYQVMLGLPTDDIASTGQAEMGGGEAAESAKIAKSDTERLRAHVRSCSTLPGSVARTDKVRIVMRIALTPQGRLAAPPALIEASASAKGPALMQAAIKALEACQPYAMLPADKYREWRVLDLGFTPADFEG